jgi:hypothetical protein
MGGKRMENQNIVLAVEKAVMETMEEMTFIVFCPSKEASLPAGSSYYPRKVFLQTHYPLTADFILVLPDELLKEITCSIYGIELEELTIEQENDVLSEILNTISGGVIKNLIPPEFTYDLGIPMLDFNEHKIAGNKKETKCIFESDEDKYIALSIFI